jgi:hypothetical protein
MQCNGNEDVRVYSCACIPAIYVKNLIKEDNGDRI